MAQRRSWKQPPVCCCPARTARASLQTNRSSWERKTFPLSVTTKAVMPLRQARALQRKVIERREGLACLRVERANEFGRASLERAMGSEGSRKEKETKGELILLERVAERGSDCEQEKRGRKSKREGKAKKKLEKERGDPKREVTRRERKRRAAQASYKGGGEGIGRE